MKHKTIIVGQSNLGRLTSEAIESNTHVVVIDNQLQPNPYIVRSVDTYIVPTYIEPRKKQTRGWTKNNRHK